MALASAFRAHSALCHRPDSEAAENMGAHRALVSTSIAVRAARPVLGEHGPMYPYYQPINLQGDLGNRRSCHAPRAYRPSLFLSDPTQPYPPIGQSIAATAGTPGTAPTENDRTRPLRHPARGQLAKNRVGEGCGCACSERPIEVVHRGGTEGDPV